MSTNKEALRFILGLKIKTLRSGKGFSLKDLAGVTGLSASYLNEIEKGKKYPKIEKLISLASGLGVAFEDLVSLKIGQRVRPLLKFLESDVFKQLPLEIFGIKPQMLFELMGQSPERFASLLTTILDIAKHYDMGLSHVNKAALRAYQEMNQNYFPDIEKKAYETLRKYRLLHKKGLEVEDLQFILTKKFNYQIDEARLGKTRILEGVKSLVRPGKMPVLLLNGHLLPQQKKFIMAKEIGRNILGLTRNHIEAESDSDLSPPSFEELKNDFHANYFAGAILVKAKDLAEDLKEILANNKFDPDSFFRLSEKYNTSSGVLFHRLIQILPRYFGIKKLFFLKFENKYTEDIYTMISELHLTELHGPYGIGLREHYCRRWITTDLLATLGKQMSSGQYDRPLIDGQISLMIESGKEYLCISHAYPDRLRPKVNICLTIGIYLDEEVKEKVHFWNDPVLKAREVARTCERCPIENCVERAAPPSIPEQRAQLHRKQDAINQLLSGL